MKLSDGNRVANVGSNIQLSGSENRFQESVSKINLPVPRIGSENFGYPSIVVLGSVLDSPNRHSCQTGPICCSVPYIKKLNICFCCFNNSIYDMPLSLRE